MPAGFDWPKRVGTFSTVIPRPKSWQEEFILKPHEAFRWFDREVLQILDRFDPIGDPSTRWKTAAFFKWFNRYFVRMLHLHHDNEEKIFHPCLKRKLEKLEDIDALDELREFPRRLEAQHEELLRLLTVLPAFEAPIAAGDAQKLREFKASMRHFVDLLEKHLDEEERVYPNILTRIGMSERRAFALEMSVGMYETLHRGNRKLLPPMYFAMCKWKGQESAATWLRTALPAPMRHRFRRAWVPDFYRRQLSVLEALKTDAPDADLASALGRLLNRDAVDEKVAADDGDSSVTQSSASSATSCASGERESCLAKGGCATA